MYCSNRGQRGGCGHTFPVFFAHVIPRHTFTTTFLWAILKTLADDQACSIKAAWEQAAAPLSLDGLYHLVQRCRHRLSALRTTLCRLVIPPAGQQTDPLRQTAAHFRAAFLLEKDPLAAFQMRLQKSCAG